VRRERRSLRPAGVRIVQRAFEPVLHENVEISLIHLPVLVEIHLRILTTHLSPPSDLLAPEGLDYHQLQDLFQSNLEPDAALFNKFHALLVMTGKDYCKPNPRCSSCPLDRLPHRTEVEYS
jgi:hypothetical protein